MKKDYSRQIFYLLLLFAIVLLGVLGKVLSSVVLPVMVSFLFSFVFYPIVKKLNQKLPNNWKLKDVIRDIWCAKRKTLLTLKKMKP